MSEDRFDILYDMVKDTNEDVKDVKKSIQIVADKTIVSELKIYGLSLLTFGVIAVLWWLIQTLTSSTQA